MNTKMGPISWVAFILVVIGGLNWGLVGAFNFNLVAWITGQATVVAQIIYILVGLGAIVMIIRSFMKPRTSEAPAQI